MIGDTTDTVVNWFYNFFELLLSVCLFYIFRKLVLLKNYELQNTKIPKNLHIFEVSNTFLKNIYLNIFIITKYFNFINSNINKCPHFFVYLKLNKCTAFKL